MGHMKRLMEVDAVEKPCLMALHYDHDTVFKLGGLYAKRKGRGLASFGRGVIDHFSRSSRNRLRLYLRNVAAGMKVCATLTYPHEFPLDGQVSKRHLRAFLQFLRRRAINYIWVVEFQERGAPHYHMLLSAPIDKEVFARTWYRIVKSGDERHFKAGTSIEWIRNHQAVGNYFYDKYITKSEQKHVPDFIENIGRFWGMTKGLVKCVVTSFVCDFNAIGWLLRPVRRWYSARMRSFGYRWEWWGKGFVAWDYGLVRGRLAPILAAA